MPAEQLGETSGKVGVDLVAGAYSFKALHLVAKGASPVILDKVKKFHSTLKTEQIATEECFNALPAITKVAIESKPDVLDEALYTVAKNTEIVKAEGNAAKAIIKTANAANQRGKDFEKLLVKKLGGKGSFEVTSKLHGTREFDGAVGKIWYEAKSGNAWNVILSNDKKLEKFRTDMGKGLTIANENGAKYELYSETPIPQEIKAWLTKHGIPYKEFLEGK